MAKSLVLIAAVWLLAMGCEAATAANPDWTTEPASEFAESQEHTRYLSCGCLQTDDPRYKPNGVFGITLHPVTITNRCAGNAIIAGFRERRYEPNISSWIPREGREYFRSEITPGDTLTIERQSTVIAFAVSPVCPSDNTNFVVIPRKGLYSPPKLQTTDHPPPIGEDSAPDFSQNYSSLVRVFAGDDAKPGAGFVITIDGYVLTARHVIGAAERPTIKVILYGTHDAVDADLVMKSKDFDAALLKIRPIAGRSYRPMPLGSPFDAVQGSPTRTLGFGSAGDNDPPSVTNGTVTIACTEARLWQIDNPTTYGDSGGPLFNFTLAHPKVIGLVTSKYADTHISYFVPLNALEDLLAAARLEVPTNASIPRPGSKDPCDGLPYY